MAEDNNHETTDGRLVGRELDKFVKEVVATEFTPSTRIYGVVLLWNKTTRKDHFYNDAYFSQKVFCQELDVSFVSFLKIRGWAVIPKNDGEIDIRYRRLKHCLDESGLNDGTVAKYYQILAMLDRVRDYFLSPDAFSADHSPPPELPPEEQMKSTVLVREKNFKTQKARGFFGNLHLSDISGKDRNRQEHQHLQLALSSIKVCFSPVIPKSKKKTQEQLDDELEKLFRVVFKECSKRRQLLEGLQDLLMYCRDSGTIEDNKAVLRSWMTKTPADILTLARKARPSTAVVEGYGDLLWQCLKKHFPDRRSIDHNNRSMDRERVVTQVLVYTSLKDMDEKPKGGNVGLSLREVLLKGSRKRKVLASCSGDNGGGDDVGSITTSTSAAPAAAVIPAHVLEELAALPSLLTPRPEHTITHPEQEMSDASEQEEEDEGSTNNNPPDNPTNCCDSLAIPYDSVCRWNKQIYLATPHEMRGVTARLVMECPDFDIRLYHSPVELYVAWQLHEIVHQFEVKPNEDKETTLLRPTIIIPDVGDLPMVKPYLVVARRGGTVFENYFPPELFQIDIAALVRFIFKHGKSDPRRSTTTTGRGSRTTTGAHQLSVPVLGSRFDFGCAGQASEPGLEYFRPKTLCKTEPFDVDKRKGETVLAILGRIVDAMCDCTHHLCDKHFGRSYTINRRRFMEFASKLRDLMYGKKADVEWITLQLLNLSHFQGGNLHLDVLNDPREGYNRTMCFCLHFIDGVGDLWSLKVITGYRKTIGDWMGGAFGKVMQLKSSIILHTIRINDGYKDILGRYGGGYIPSKPPSWEDTSSFWLDDYMPYEVRYFSLSSDGTDRIELQYFRMVTGTTLSYWLSPALTGAYLLAPYVPTVRGMVQLAVMAVCQESFEHYYLVTREMVKNMQKMHQFDKYPMLTYIDMCERMFITGRRGVSSGTEFIGVGSAPPRYEPVKIDFKHVFESGAQVDLLVDELLMLIELVNAIEDDAVDRSTMEPKLISTSNRIRDTLPGCELDPFRLLLFLQFCVHLNVGLTLRTSVRNLLFPIVGETSHRVIVDTIGFADSRVDEICSLLRSEMSTPSRPVFMDEIEPLLCETKSHRRWEGYDIFIKGQYLFRLDEQGVPLVKVYGDQEMWSRVTSLREDPYNMHCDVQEQEY